MKAGCVVIDEGRVLLITNKKRTDFQFPKGHIERDETAAAAAIRETREETGYEVALDHFLCDIRYTSRNHIPQQPVVVHLYNAHVIRQVDGRTDELFEWISIKDAMKELRPKLVRALKLAIKKKASGPKPKS